jgi:hypothetical protein
VRKGYYSMSIKTQKILKYIPVVNFIIIFYWINAYAKNVTSTFRFLKNLLKVFGIILLINIPRIVLDFLSAPTIVQNIIFILSVYLSLFSWTVIAIKDQEKFISESKNS